MIDEVTAAGLRSQLDEIRASGLYKDEKQLDSPQGAHIETRGSRLINLCANNYLGLANHPAVVGAAKDALDRWGFGMASVRFISGTQRLHRELEEAISALLGTEDTILFPSCFDANGAVFEVLLGADDTVISDELNHASIIDGIRLSKARRRRYRNRDMGDLADQLKGASGDGRTLVVTDGVFSMDGYIAPLDEICALGDTYGAIVMVDDSHAVGLLGATGAGTPELMGVSDRVDIITGTLGKALGGGSGGYVSGHGAIVELLRQRGRPYLFSNAVPPAIVAGSLAALRLVADGAADRARLASNAARFRSMMTAEGFELLPGEHPIVPVMIPDAAEAGRMADALFVRGVYVTAFSYPVVPLGRSRLRVQLSSEHTDGDIDAVVAAFRAARSELG